MKVEGEVTAQQVLVLTGGIATGESTIAAEIGEILSGQGRSCIVIELDHLGWAYIPSDAGERVARLRADNLAAIWPNIVDAGIRFAIIAGALITAEAIE